MNKRTMVMLGVLVVAVVVGYVAFSGIYPPRHGTEGTIGAANVAAALASAAGESSPTTRHLSRILATTDVPPVSSGQV